jgi:hypothetical protein
VPLIMRANRAFLHRAVRFLLDAGVRQFLDLVSGIPTVGNVHEIAQKADPDARVVYVDVDPVAVAHSRLLLAGNDHAAVVRWCDRLVRRARTTAARAARPRTQNDKITVDSIAELAHPVSHKPHVKAR